MRVRPRQPVLALTQHRPGVRSIANAPNLLPFMIRRSYFRGCNRYHLLSAAAVRKFAGATTWTAFGASGGCGYVFRNRGMPFGIGAVGSILGSSDVAPLSIGPITSRPNCWRLRTLNGVLHYISTGLATQSQLADWGLRGRHSGIPAGRWCSGALTGPTTKIGRKNR